MDSGGRHEFVWERRGDAQRNASAEAVSDANLRSRAGSRVGGDCTQESPGVGDHVLGRDAGRRFHHSLRLGPLQSDGQHPRHVKAELFTHAVIEVGRDAVVAAGRKPPSVLLHLLAIADAIHENNRHRERPLAVRSDGKSCHVAVGGANANLFLNHGTSAAIPRSVQLTVTTTYPVFCSVSTYRVASTTSSSG